MGVETVMQEISLPLVSVCTLTYNHVPYIRQCIEGVLMQRTTFPIELIIHDDASTDGTAGIIREYQEKYPDVIISIFQKENQYSKQVPISTTYVWPKIRGKYVAICEGDDYWTDPLKLQKQVDYLEAHPGCGLVYSSVRFFHQKKGKFRSEFVSQVELDDLLLKNSIPTLTTCFRTDLLRDYEREMLPELPAKMPFGDYPIWIFMAMKSSIRCFSEIMGVYRVLENSASHHTSVERDVDFKNKVLEFQLFIINRFFPEKANQFEYKVKLRRAIDVLSAALVKKEMSLFREKYISFASDLRNNKKLFLIFSLFFYFPFLIHFYSILLMLSLYKSRIFRCFS
ncbi:MAG: glycosyltransferase [Porphyromonas sp.]|nr:glycosyltransferase [Porphyromonas sp.]